MRLPQIPAWETAQQPLVGAPLSAPAAASLAAAVALQAAANAPQGDAGGMLALAAHHLPQLQHLRSREAHLAGTSPLGAVAAAGAPRDGPASTLSAPAFSFGTHSSEEQPGPETMLWSPPRVQALAPPAPPPMEPPPSSEPSSQRLHRVQGFDVQDGATSQ